MNKLRKQQIRNDNPHFQGDLIRKESGIYFENVGKKKFRFFMTIGCTGNKYEAVYVFEIQEKKWYLGSN